MNFPFALAIGGLAGLTALTAVAEDYPLGPDSEPRDVPHGVVTQHTWTSTIFPGTLRDYWIYVPAQYTPDKPACVMVFQDGGGFANAQSRWRIPVVFDNLIHDGAMPVTIGIFVNPGFLPPAAEGRQGRPNRSFEYDAVSDRYARFLTDEILPKVGHSYNLSPDPNDRAICGASSGGICAFTAAWFRPDAFRRVLSFVGSFSNLRGGDAYPSLIRKSETRPIRVVIQSGAHDMDTYAGSWYVQNQAMAAAFEYMGYDYQVTLGSAGHDDRQGGSMLPDALRWLWRDWPAPLTAPRPPDSREWATNIVEAQHPWEPVEGFPGVSQALAADDSGRLFVAEVGTGRILELAPDGTRPIRRESCGEVRAMACGPDGTLYLSAGDQITACPAAGPHITVASGVEAGGLFACRGGLYYTDPARRQVCFAAPGAAPRVVAQDPAYPTGVRVSPDGGLAMVADACGRWAWSYQVQADGALTNGQAFYRLETADETSATGAAAVALDEAGALYVATEPGIQVCDAEGRTAFIMLNPPAGSATSFAFAGPSRQTVYALSGGQLYRRALLRRGAPI